jgi:hypothetical protein
VKGLLRHGASALALFGLATAALYPFCGLAFRCGCVAMGWGGAERCNVHGSAGPHCPWCEHPGLGTVGLLLTLSAQGLVYLGGFRRSASAATATFAAALAFPLAALLAAFLTWLPTDYPHFLAKGARASLGMPAGPVRCVRPGP